MTGETLKREARLQQPFGRGNETREGHGDLQEGQLHVVMETINTCK